MNQKKQYPEGHCIWVNDKDIFSCPRFENSKKKKKPKIYISQTHICFSMLAVDKDMLKKISHKLKNRYHVDEKSQIT